MCNKNNSVGGERKVILSTNPPQNILLYNNNTLKSLKWHKSKWKTFKLYFIPTCGSHIDNTALSINCVYELVKHMLSV